MIARIMARTLLNPLRRAGLGRAGARTRAAAMRVAAAILTAASLLPSRSSAADFIAGADCSHLAFFEQRGSVYRTDGEVRDALAILKQQGLTCVRLRLFTSTAEQAQADPYNRINNLAYTLPLAVRCKQAGLQVLLDFHYSDTWADPGKQAKPSAWTNLSFPQLEQRLYEYNRDTLNAFKAAGALPDYVQVGNEITPGMLWPDGRVGGAYENATQWSQLGRLLKAAIRGVREASGAAPPKLMIHIDRGGDWPATQWYFDHLREQQVEFDLIGQSYYPFWHGTMEALRGCLTNAAARYGKPVIVAETAFPWTNSTDVAGFPATPAGQNAYLIALAKVVKGVPGGRGAGIFWWGTEYQRLAGVNTAGFESRSFFDAGGNVLPAARTLGQLATPIVLRAGVTGRDLRVQWPLSGAGLALFTSTNPALPADWRLWSDAVEIAPEGFAATLAVGLAPARFFRLQSN